MSGKKFGGDEKRRKRTNQINPRKDKRGGRKYAKVRPHRVHQGTNPYLKH